MTEPDTTHECPAPWCKRRVPFFMFACRPDWHVLSREVRTRIWRAFDRDPQGPEHLAAMSAAHQEYRDMQATGRN